MSGAEGGGAGCGEGGGLGGGLGGGISDGGQGGGEGEGGGGLGGGIGDPGEGCGKGDGGGGTGGGSGDSERDSRPTTPSSTQMAARHFSRWVPRPPLRVSRCVRCGVDSLTVRTLALLVVDAVICVLDQFVAPGHA